MINYQNAEFLAEGTT